MGTKRSELRRTKAIAPFNHEDRLLGTTTNDYVSALDLDARGMRSKTIILKNTDGSNSLKYKLLVSVMYSHGEQAEEVAEATLATGAVAKFRYVGAYARMILQVKAASAGNQATYSADYTMSGI